ncbi:MAG: hypothetical protein A2Y73_03795 [Chloroflexi bacterium RBG_13_56_8]|nr:MAG: hypothetical protein A2Y73_03795 [Chloroflexi bacterium RBG_13_56_8]
MIHVEPVTSRAERKDFVMFPFKLYRSDPYWVPPLISDRLKHFDPEHNPFYEHAEVQLFRALRGGETVGTIAAIADELHPQVWGEPVGFFGAFESIDADEVAAALFTEARAWLASRGREVMRGPIDMNIHGEVGLLIEGFGQPVIMMPYQFPYYQGLLERYGMVKAKDVHAYKLDIASYGPNLERLPEQIARVARIATERYGVCLRYLDFDHFEEEVELLRPIYREAWSKNWGEVPITQAELAQLANELRQIADPGLVYLATIDEQVIGCFVAIPDYCQVAKHLNGRLFPIGWAKFLWYRRKINGIRVLIMGVLEEHRLKGVDALFIREAARRSAEKGYEWVEMSWILEDNYRAIRGIETMGGNIYRTYRLYDIPTR